MVTCEIDLQNILSKRELECAALLLRGNTCKSIARILSISHRTVEEYVSNLRKKLNSKNRAELIYILSQSKPIFELVNDLKYEGMNKSVIK